MSSEGQTVSLHDRRWIEDSTLPGRIEEFLTERAPPTKLWVNARYVADRIGESSMAVGPALAAMYRSDDVEVICDRRLRSKANIYRVNREVVDE